MRYAATGRARAPSGGVTKQATGSGARFAARTPDLFWRSDLGGDVFF